MPVLRRYGVICPDRVIILAILVHDKFARASLSRPDKRHLRIDSLEEIVAVT